MLSPRNRKRLRNWGSRMLKRPQKCVLCPGTCVQLSDLPSGAQGTVQCNYDTRTIERGLYLGVPLEVYRNESSEPNLIVAVGDSRYVLDRRIAGSIRVKVL